MAFTKINAAGIGTTERVTVDGLTVINNLSVGGTVSIAGTLTYEDVTNIDAVGLITARDGIFVSAGSSIGIGTAAPADILHLRSTGPILKVDATNNASGLRIDVLGQTGGTNNQLFRVQRDGTTKLQLNDDGDLVITGNDNSELKLKAGTATGEDKVVFLNSDGDTKGNISYDTVNNSLAFKLGGVAASDEKLSITSGGRVGVGTTNPDSVIHVYKDAPAYLINVERASNQNSSIKYENSVGSMFAGLASNAEGWGIDDDSDIGSGPMFFVAKATGYVGINCKSDDSLVEIKSTESNRNILRLRDYASDYRYLDFDVTGATSTITSRSNNSHGNIAIGSSNGAGGVNKTNLYIQGPTGYLGIRTDDPQRNLHSHSTGSGANYIQITNDTTGSGATQGSLVGIDQNENLIFWTYGAGDSLRFGTAGSERMTLDTSGHLNINDGNLVISTAGHGIDFSATAEGSGTSSENELLDDYEEGTFTPTSQVGTFTNAKGRYIKVGHQVTLWIEVPTISDTTDTGNFQINGLPFAMKSDASQAVGSVMIRYVDNTNGDTTQVVSYQIVNTSYLRLFACRDDGNNYEAVKHAEFTQTVPGIRVCHSYQSA
tara:strand:+ start:1119 stop:2924 length:1806 start_codon:yes stop_codon:yes gene_type:complete